MLFDNQSNRNLVYHLIDFICGSADFILRKIIRYHYSNQTKRKNISISVYVLRKIKIVWLLVIFIMLLSHTYSKFLWFEGIITVACFGSFNFDRNFISCHSLLSLLDTNCSFEDFIAENISN